jgi:hypothetical protein
MAAGLLDEFHVTSLDDDSALGRYMAREFGVVRNEILEAYPWHIAMDRAVLSKLSTDPAFDWLYQYQIPSTWLRVIPPSVDGTWNDAPISYELNSGKLLCNVGPTLNAKGIRREINLAKWTALMGRAFAAKMAMYASQRVTGKAAYFDKCRTAFSDAMNEAKHVDSLTRGTQPGYYSSGFDGNDSVSVRENGYQ